MAGKSALDKELKRLGRLETALAVAGGPTARYGLALLFLLAVLVYVMVSFGAASGGFYVIVAGVVGGYMALNIGANDVANNMGPAVGAKVLTLGGALIIAAIFEIAGALLAGGDVVATVSKGIIKADTLASAESFIWVMVSALFAAAVWVNLATIVGAPVSTTHSIVGGVLGAGLASAGAVAVNWPVMLKIAASWVISPVLGGVLAAMILLVIKYLILFREDRLAAAQRWVPLLVAVMGSAFSVYLSMKGLKRVWKASPDMLVIIGVISFIITYLLVRPAVLRASRGLDNRRKSVYKLFTIPLIFSAALLSFAHGANDVANAVGPLAAVVSAVETDLISGKVEVPFWVMLTGALGLSIGLALFGPKLIRVVGAEITRLNPARAYAVALSAAITVIIASALGLPVSSTHIAVGGVFGVGFLREYLANRPTAQNVPGQVSGGGQLQNTQAQDKAENTAKARKRMARRRLVRRHHAMTIVAAWGITVPAAAVIAMVICLGFERFMSTAG